MVDSRLQFEEVTTSDEPRRWAGFSAVAAVAAVTVLVVAGVVVANRESSDDPVSSPPVTNPIATVAQADPVPYQWSQVPHDEAVFGGARGQRMRSVTVGGPGLVAVGSVGNDRDADAAVWTSVDGITWSRVPHDEVALGGPGGQVMSSVVAGGPGLVAVGHEQLGDDVPSGRAQDAAVWTSVDGITWSRVPHDEALFGGTGNQRMRSVTITDAGLVAVGADGGFYSTRGEAVVWTSVDGLTWVRVPHDDAVFGGAEMHSVTVADAGLVVVGEDSPAGTRAERENLIVSAIVWVAEPEP